MNDSGARLTFLIQPSNQRLEFTGKRPFSPRFVSTHQKRPSLARKHDVRFRE